ncbi:hypothetical protein KIL84_006906 [Mauremys mutica]|uniref:Uncharacterized protein n=1 Tax=Mauremys mutica TaxID=74926 RepID=A0A9D3X291_9SAUR|nr:hypothetical protein KIL84_006906 [Mauremys mutica]
MKGRRKRAGKRRGGGSGGEVELAAAGDSGSLRLLGTGSAQRVRAERLQLNGAQRRFLQQPGRPEPSASREPQLQLVSRPPPPLPVERRRLQLFGKLSRLPDARVSVFSFKSSLCSLGVLIAVW